MGLEPNKSGLNFTHIAKGVWQAPGARIIDRSGRKRLPIGYADFAMAMSVGAIVDKTMLIADVLDSGYAATLFCRPRRFGKTLNMTMMKEFLEAPEAGGLSKDDAAAIFSGTEIWDAANGAYYSQQGVYPVVHISFSTAKKLNWADSLAEIRGLVADEYLRHAYLREDGSPLLQEDIAYFDSIANRTASDAEFARSLAVLCRMLHIYHDKGAVVLIDEYDAPVMAGYTNGYYDQVVSFLKGWLTGALKDGGATVSFSCLTGVQRISKESVFSDLNNLYVSTSLDTAFDERYGFTDAEVAALAAYLGHSDCTVEINEWYDGYRFGNQSVYNPWSVISYLNSNCTPGTYWGNTSGNSVVGDLVSHANAETLEDVYALLKPDGVVYARLDLGVAFPDLGVREGALWSMLYLAGYLTTDDVSDPSDDMRRRPLRIPNREVARLYRNEVLRRFLGVAGGERRLDSFHRALVSGDETAFQAELEAVVERASSFDLTNELACHMLLMGLLFGVLGYRDPLSNREAGYGRYDIQLVPNGLKEKMANVGFNNLPLITIELKYLDSSNISRGNVALNQRLSNLAREALSPIADRAYDSSLPKGASGRLRWGIAFCGKHVAVASERA